jgi:N-acetylmuramoyl-L-alanine amidase
MLTISNHRVEKVLYCDTPNKSSGINKLKYLVIHYTASNSFINCIRRFQDKQSKVSAHFLIGRNGELHQFGKCTDILWHAGQSEWNGLKSLNAHSIGIEQINWGILTEKKGRFYAYTGKEVPVDEVYTDEKGRHWQTYTYEQLSTLYDLVTALVRAYQSIECALGHSEVSPGRKSDPGEAFDMKALNQHIKQVKQATQKPLEALPSL